MAMRPDVRRHTIVIIVFSLLNGFLCVTSWQMNFSI
jgi:hypothetical protein